MHGGGAEPVRLSGKDVFKKSLGSGSGSLAGFESPIAAISEGGDNGTVVLDDQAKEIGDGVT